MSRKGGRSWLAIIVLAVIAMLMVAAFAQGQQRMTPAQALDVLADDLGRLSVRVNDVRDATFQTERAAALQRELMDAVLAAWDAMPEDARPEALAESVEAMRVDG